MRWLLALAIVLGLVCMAGGGALMVRGHAPLQQVVLQPTIEHHTVERAIEREPAATITAPRAYPRRTLKSPPAQTARRQAPAAHPSARRGHRQPGDDSADALNRRQLRAE